MKYFVKCCIKEKQVHNRLTSLICSVEEANRTTNYCYLNMFSLAQKAPIKKTSLKAVG